MRLGRWDIALFSLTGMGTQIKLKFKKKPPFSSCAAGAGKMVSNYRKFFTLTVQFRLTKMVNPINQYPFSRNNTDRCW
jgi:hypothetical protein